MKTFKHALLAAGLALSVSPLAHAGGIALGSTRVVYPQGEKQVSLPVMNTASDVTFLIQSWVSNADGSKATSFIVTPPLFVIKPHGENTLRIMYNGPMLPQDRESVFYINSKAIPSVPKSSLKGNTLQIATQSVIKLFMRPSGLPTPPAQAPDTLKCQLSAGNLTLTNPSPYYVTLVQLYVGKQKQANTMVAPKSSLSVKTTATGSVHFQTLNDYGTNTPDRICQG